MMTTYTTTNKLVVLFYLLMRDELPTSKLVGAIKECEKDQEYVLTSGYLAQYAEDLVGRLTTSGDCDDSVCTNEEFWKVVDEAFLAGVTESEVSDVFGSSLTTVSRWKSHKGAPCSETQVRKFAVDKLKEMISNKNKQE